MRDSQQDSQEQLLYVERVTGRALRTRKDMDRYFEFLNEIHPPRKSGPSLHEACLVAKRVVFVALVAFATFQYFAVDVVTEVLSIDKIRFMAPPAPVTATVATRT